MSTGIRCKECKQLLPPNFMLWNQICVFCWFCTDRYRGRNKQNAVIKEKHLKRNKR